MPEFVDPNACASEPIHIPGRIQGFGCLLVLDLNLRVRHASANVQEYFGQSAQALQGEHIDQVIGAHLCIELHILLKNSPEAKSVVFRRARLWPQPGPVANLTVRHQGGLWALEIEPCFESGSEQSEQAYLEQQQRIQALLYRGLSCLHDTEGLTDLCTQAVKTIGELTGYHRVMVYRFDSQWRGSVIAESKQAEMASYLGQSFPASDIPPQAREVFVHCASRMIADVGAKPVPLVPALDPVTGRPFDMGQVQLRWPSPVHLEYLTNMEVCGTLTLSILVERRLWGLIACHHQRPLALSVPLREAAEILAKAFSALITPRLYEDTQALRARLQERVGVLTRRLATTHNAALALLEGDINLGNLWAPKEGSAAVLIDGQWHRTDHAPNENTCARIAQWLKHTHGDMDVFESNSLSKDVALDIEQKKTCCGLLALRLPKIDDLFVLFFAPEVLQVIDWAGRPEKYATQDNGSRLHPRQSFASYSETVRGHSVAWEILEIHAARQLRQALIEWDLGRQVAKERQSRADGEAEKQRFALLATASIFFGKPLGDGAALQGLAQFLVQQFCDWLIIKGVDDEHGAHVAMAHREAGKLALLNNHAESLVASLPGLLAQATNHLHIDAAWACKNPVLAELGFSSCIAVPLSVHGRDLGMLFFVRGRGSQDFDEFDVRLAQQLAQRVAGLVDNDMSFRKSTIAIRSREFVLRIVSHDLRNPIGLVSLSSQSLRRRLMKSGSDNWQDPVDRIDRACLTMQRLIDDMLSAATIESGGFQVRCAWLTAEVLLQEVHQALEPLCRAADLTFYTKICGAGGRMYADKERLMQALGNLVSNAIRFTPSKGQISIELQRCQQEMRMTVRDTGGGIPAAKLGKIFDQFWQGDQGAQSGAGLGLFIVRGIVQAHRGQIWVESEVGVGTTFHLTCPDAPGLHA